MSRLIVHHYLKWICLASVVGLLSGTASAIFLALLEGITKFREAESWLILLAPLGGLLVGYAYTIFGPKLESGNNLIIQEFHSPRSIVPLRLTPLVLFGTLVTHVFGGSAGREGTAVQMGSSLADQLSRIFKMNGVERRLLLMAGMSGGFGSVFGVPFAGMIFGLEVLTIGRLHIWALIECGIAAFVAHHTTLLLGVTHTPYPRLVLDGLWSQPSTWISAVAAGIAFGLAARLFSWLMEGIKSFGTKLFPFLPRRAFAGGILLSVAYASQPELMRYAGLGIPAILESMTLPVPGYDWLAKTFATAWTLGMGFKGGEVTPLLFIGSTLGNALSAVLPLSLPILAALGFVAVFAGAANTPFACVLMAAEIFGIDILPLALVACFASYATSGYKGIYHAQSRPTSGRKRLPWKPLTFELKRQEPQVDGTDQTFAGK